MARKSSKGDVNKSEAIRELLKENPEIKATDAVVKLKEKGIKIAPSLFYFIKGKLKGSKGRRRKIRKNVAAVMASGNANGTQARHSGGDVLSTIKKVKSLAKEVGGLKKLTALVEALGQ